MYKNQQKIIKRYMQVWMKIEIIKIHRWLNERNDFDVEYCV